MFFLIIYVVYIDTKIYGTGIVEIVHGHNEEQSTSSQSSKKKRRGPTTGKKYKTHEPKFIEWSEYGNPIGKWANCYRTYIGDTVRSKIDINVNKWDEVSVGLKDTIWEDVKVFICRWIIFIIISYFNRLTFIFYFYLSQNEFQIDDKMKGVVLKTVGGRWKDFKTRLVSGWITKKRKLPADRGEPYEYYDGITQAQWETFKKNHETEKFKVYLFTIFESFIYQIYM